MVHAPIWKAELGQIADRHPGLKIIIDHMGITYLPVNRNRRRTHVHRNASAAESRENPGRRG
jgi:predicted TIM-barrel fold metal-dependent hydrolase